LLTRKLNVIAPQTGDALRNPEGKLMRGFQKQPE
jgi:hypothetical protein